MTEFDKRALWWLVLVVVLVLALCALCTVRKPSVHAEEFEEGPLIGCRLISETEHCLRPQDVMTTECVYDGANDTYLYYKPSSIPCAPLYAPGDVGVLYTRRQWTSACCGWPGSYD